MKAGIIIVSILIIGILVWIFLSRNKSDEKKSVSSGKSEQDKDDEIVPDNKEESLNIIDSKNTHSQKTSLQNLSKELHSDLSAFSFFDNNGRKEGLYTRLQHASEGDLQYVSDHFKGISGESLYDSISAQNFSNSTLQKKVLEKLNGAGRGINHSLGIKNVS